MVGTTEELLALEERLLAVQKATGKRVTGSPLVMECFNGYEGFAGFAVGCMERHFLLGEEGLKNGKDTDHYFPFPDERMENGINPDPMLNCLVIRDDPELDSISTFVGLEVWREEIAEELEALAG